MKASINAAGSGLGIGRHRVSKALPLSVVASMLSGSAKGPIRSSFSHCNAGKRDSDSIDFRGVLQSYGRRQQGCLFCDLQTSDRVLLRKELAVCIADAYPVSEGHSLVIPCRHLADGMELHQPEWNAVSALLKQRRCDLELADASISGFNVGLNSGESARQTVMHAHWHLIPRRKGERPAPRDGVRGVIPGKQRY